MERKTNDFITPWATLGTYVSLPSSARREPPWLTQLLTSARLRPAGGSLAGKELYDAIREGGFLPPDSWGEKAWKS